MVWVDLIYRWRGRMYYLFSCHYSCKISFLYNKNEQNLNTIRIDNKNTHNYWYIVQTLSSFFRDVHFYKRYILYIIVKRYFLSVVTKKGVAAIIPNVYSSLRFGTTQFFSGDLLIFDLSKSPISSKHQMYHQASNNIIDTELYNVVLLIFDRVIIQ
jgi:hypothetical protein